MTDIAHFTIDGQATPKQRRVIGNAFASGCRISIDLQDPPEVRALVRALGYAVSHCASKIRVRYGTGEWIVFKDHDVF